MVLVRAHAQPVMIASCIKCHQWCPSTRTLLLHKSCKWICLTYPQFTYALQTCMLAQATYGVQMPPWWSCAGTADEI